VEKHVKQTKLATNRKQTTKRQDLYCTKPSGWRQDDTIRYDKSLMWTEKLRVDSLI